MAKIILIIADFKKNNRLIMSMEQLPSQFFKSVAFCLGHLVIHGNVQIYFMIYATEIGHFHSEICGGFGRESPIQKVSRHT